MADTSSHYVDNPRWLPHWDGETYAANTAHHRAHDEWFLAGLPIEPGDRVLDVGCGAGDFTAVLAGLVPGGHVVGLDAQRSMVEAARRRARPNQSFVVGPAQEIDSRLARQAPFDLAVSRAVLHWVPWPEIPSVLDGLRAVLRPGGWFRMECGGGDNIPKVVPLLDDVSSAMDGPRSPWSFRGAGAWLEVLGAHGFRPDAGGHVRTVAQRRPFDEGTLWGWFTSQVAQAYEVGRSEEWAAEFRATVRARLGELRRSDGSWDQTFVRADVLVRR